MRVFSLNGQAHVSVHRRRGEAGYSFIDLMIYLVISSLLMSTVLTGYIGFQKWRFYDASRVRLEQILGSATSLLRDDLRPAGAGLRFPGGDKLVIQDGTTKKSRPAAFLDEKGTTMTILATNQEGVGDVVSSSGNKLVVMGVDFDKWQGLKPGGLVMVISVAGAPVLLQVQSQPRKAVQADLPDGTMEKPNFDRTVMFETTKPSDCWKVASLGTEIFPTSQAIPVTRVVQYSMVPETGLVRSENTVCQDTLGITNRVGDIMPLLPLMDQTVQFSYLTNTGGTSNSLPSDPSTILGIQAKITLTDPSSHLSKGIVTNVYLESWQ